jgi:hypothetical protein
VTQADGKKLSLEKSGGKWRMTEPVSAEAEAFEVDALVRAIVNLSSQGTTDAQATGLAKPTYTIDLNTAAGKGHTLRVGDKTAVGDNLYVALKDDNRTHVVGADLLERLEKQPGDFRSKKLVEMSTGDVTKIEINKAGSGGGRIVLAKSGGDWKVTEPQQFPAEKADVDNILFDLTGLRANEFVSESATADAAMYDLESPRITATLHTGKPELPVGVAAPTTAPSTTQATSQPAPLVIKFGRYDDVLKKNVFVSTSASPVVAAVGVNVLEAINKKPIELRDRKVFDAEPEHASEITIVSDLAATTQPTSRPASKKEVVLRRTKPTAATAPTTAPTTQLAATQGTTQPATQVAASQPAATQPATKWEVVVSAGEVKPADDSKVDSLLSQLHPLRAQKYLETAPTTQPTATYVVKVATAGPGGTPVNNYELKLVDPGDSKPLIGTYNGLAFEVDRFFVDRITGDFVKGASPAGGFANEGSFNPVGP